MENDIQLPEELAPFIEKIKATRKEAMKITPRPEVPSTPWQSCFGGNPYLPASAEFPVNDQGEHLFFLAQINFEEAPRMNAFPEKGLLQFFIFDDATYGQDAEDPYRQNSWRVVYYPEIIRDPSALVSDFSFLREYNNPPLTIGQAYSLSFEISFEYLPVDDYRFELIFGRGFFKQFGENSWMVFDEYYERFGADGHKLGGYPDFAQDDPRSPEENLELLFQLDSDYDIQCMWGDVGVGNFFIRPEELEALDFSRVYYHWDSN
jgi:uncharacterized protein YwqG